MRSTLLYLWLGIFIWGNVGLQSFVVEMKQVKISTLDVGQGQAVLIRYQGYNILVDTGESPELVDRLNQELPFFDKSIDCLIITHAHSDHYGASFLLAKRYQVDHVILSRLVGRNYRYRLLLDQTLPKPILTPAKLDEPTIQTTRLTIDDLEIDFIQLPPPYNNRNNSSIVTWIRFGEVDWLITGDLESDRETELLPHLSGRNFEYYVAGHHGSSTSSSEALLKAITPEITLISAGTDNKFGHPSPEALGRIKAHQSQIKRTDTAGTITYLCSPTDCFKKN